MPPKLLNVCQIDAQTRRSTDGIMFHLNKTFISLYLLDKNALFPAKKIENYIFNCPLNYLHSNGEIVLRLGREKYVDGLLLERSIAGRRRPNLKQA